MTESGARSGGHEVEDLAFEPFRVRLRQEFRRVTERRGVLVGGPAGWAEWSPFPEYDDRVAGRWWECAREAATTELPAPVRDRVPVNVTVPAVDPETARRLVARSGCRTAKVKVAERGQTHLEDVARVEAVRDALGPDGRIRVDANAAWDVDTAVRRLAELDRAAGGLEYAEQPCPTVRELAQLRRRVDVRLAADESLRLAHDPLRVDLSEAADVLVLKVQPLGGVRRALRVAEAQGLPAVVSSALETSVGLAVGLALAAALPELDMACGLGTAMLLEDDPVVDRLVPIDGWLTVRRVVPDPELLARLALPPFDAGAQHARLERARSAAWHRRQRDARRREREAEGRADPPRRRSAEATGPHPLRRRSDRRDDR